MIISVGSLQRDITHAMHPWYVHDPGRFVFWMVGTGNAVTFPVDVYTERRLGPPHASLLVVSSDNEQRPKLTLRFRHTPYYSRCPAL